MPTGSPPAFPGLRPCRCWMAPAFWLPLRPGPRPPFRPVDGERRTRRSFQRPPGRLPHQRPFPSGRRVPGIGPPIRGPGRLRFRRPLSDRGPWTEARPRGPRRPGRPEPRPFPGAHRRTAPGFRCTGRHRLRTGPGQRAGRCRGGSGPGRIREFRERSRGRAAGAAGGGTEHRTGPGAGSAWPRNRPSRPPDNAPGPRPWPERSWR